MLAPGERRGLGGHLQLGMSVQQGGTDSLQVYILVLKRPNGVLGSVKWAEISCADLLEMAIDFPAVHICPGV